METRKASLGRDWEALTDEHKAELETAEDLFDRFEDGETVDPLGLVGAYRSGKTQLLYHLFAESWARGVPAFYIGDPGSMLDEFQESDSDNLNDWIEYRIEEHLDAYEERDIDGVDWFPNVDTQTKEEYINKYGSIVSGADVSKSTLLFDEVEQSYRAFIRAMDKDDDNPLRKINDGLQDSLKVWSFGMISAFEFIGEADWGRIKEIRIPPLDVADVRSLLKERQPAAADLANIIWWLSRGRTGIIIKLIDELPTDPEDGAIDWLETLAEADFKDTRLINNLWTELNREDWDAAITALLFREDGLDAWTIDDEVALKLEGCQSIIVDIIKEGYSFEETDSHRRAISIIDRNVERVLQGLAINESQLFPRFGLSEQVEADAFLDLVTNMTVSFEPAADERRVAVDAIDDIKGSLHPKWMQEVTKTDQVEGPVETASPEIIRDSFPPIAVNPERVSPRTTEELRKSMDQGLALNTGLPANEIVSIRFCPNASAFNSETSELINSYDITNPTLLVVPEEEFDTSLPDDAQPYQDHQLLKVEEYQSNRFWSFVLNLYGRMDREQIGDPYYVDNSGKNALIEQINEREVRNTIETLYDQLYQVAEEEIERFANEYESIYSLENTTTLVWNEERLQDDTPYWSNGQFAESTIALSYLPVFGPDYEKGREYSKIHQYFKTGIKDGLVNGGQSGFGFKEYFDNMFTQSGYSGPVTSERNHYRQGSHLDPAVQQTRSALTSLAALQEGESLIQELNDQDVDVGQNQVPVVGIPGVSDLANAFLRPLLVCGLTNGSDPPIDVTEYLEGSIDDLQLQLEIVDDYIERVEALDESLSSPESADVGSWVDIETHRLDQFKTNLRNLIEACEDLEEKCQADSGSTPIGYHYWFFVNLYLEDISDIIDDLESKIHQASSSDISDAVTLYDEIHTTISESDAVSMHFESRESILSQLEEYGDEIFDLQAEQGSTTLSIPEDQDDLVELNASVGDHIDELSQMHQDIEKIESQSTEIAKEIDQTKDALNKLLHPKEMEVSHE